MKIVISRKSVLVVLLLTALLTIPRTSASTIVVTSPADPGPGTLRAALESGANGDTIDLTAVTGVIDLTAGELLVTKNITIAGSGSPGLAVIADGTSRVFNVRPNATVSISGLSVIGGKADAGGGILNDHADLTLSNVDVVGNSAPNGGGIYSDGGGAGGHASLRIIQCKLSENIARCDGCGWGGGAIFNSGAEGGSASVEILNSTIDGNSAVNPGNSPEGGGICSMGDSGGAASLQIVNSTISNNSSIGGNALSSRSGEVKLVNSTLSGNHGGSGIMNLNSHLVILNSTVMQPTSVAIETSGDQGTSLVEIGSSICIAYHSVVFEVGSSTTKSLGYNLSNMSGAWLTETGDQSGVDPQLGPLQDNGGPTPTMMLLPNSPAIDRGKNLSGAATDQRGPGYPRTIDSYFFANASDGTDIGAVEMPASSGPGMQKQIPAAEYAALVDLYNSTHGDNWGDRTGWLDPNAPTWHGVTVSGFSYDSATGNVITEGTVSQILLRGNGLLGPLPDSIGNLKNPQILDLSYNGLNGSIPAGLGNATALQGLNLSNNVLTGSIPESLGNLADLVWLNLSNEWWGPPPRYPRNQLTGPIPASFGQLTKLQSLALSENQLSGSIPESIGNLSSLTEIYLSDNQLNGSIPVSFGNLVNLRVVYLYNNQLSGSIPAAFGNLVQIYDLRMDQNQLSGEIPASLGNLVHLRYFYLSSNQLSGDIPASLGNLVALEELRFSGNHLSGAIPAALGNLTNLTMLELSNNELSGSIPASLSNIQYLYYLLLNGNQLSGSIPDGLGNLRLNGLDLSDNRLSGTIPESLGNLVYLGQWLNLSRNQLTGSIPASLGNLAAVSSFDLSHNQLIGTIPDSLGNLANAFVVNLSDNQLTGTVPGGLAALTELYSLDLSSNGLTGNLPEGWGSGLHQLNLALNCFDLSAGSQPSDVVAALTRRGVAVTYQPQRDDCQSPALGDLNGDGCVDHSDLALIMVAIRSHSQSRRYDLNGDGKVDVADARSLVLHFTRPDGSPCTGN